MLLKIFIIIFIIIILEHKSQKNTKKIKTDKNDKNFCYFSRSFYPSLMCVNLWICYNLVTSVFYILFFFFIICFDREEICEKCKCFLTQVFLWLYIESINGSRVASIIVDRNYTFPNIKVTITIRWSEIVDYWCVDVCL